jgi:hypothetical protein
MINLYFTTMAIKHASQGFIKGFIEYVHYTQDTYYCTRTVCYVCNTLIHACLHTYIHTYIDLLTSKMPLGYSHLQTASYISTKGQISSTDADVGSPTISMYQRQTPFPWSWSIFPPQSMYIYVYIHKTSLGSDQRSHCRPMFERRPESESGKRC